MAWDSDLEPQAFCVLAHIGRYYGRMQIMPQKLWGGQKQKDGFLRRNQRNKGGKGCTSYVGGTLYFRRTRFRGCLFLRMWNALLFLPKSGNRHRKLWKRDYCGTACRNFSGTGRAGSGQSEPGNGGTLCAADHPGIGNCPQQRL